MKAKFPFLDHEGVIPIAHRGGNAAGAGKENTLAAFQAAYDMGYRYFETDGVLTSDGVIIAYHGIRSARKAKQAGWLPRRTLQSMTIKEIQDTVRVAGEPIPSLELLLDSFTDVFFNIDPKTAEVATPLGKLLKRKKALDRVCVGSVVYKRTLKVARAAGGQDKLCTVLTGSQLMVRGGLRFRGLPLKNYLLKTQAGCLEVPYYSLSKRVVTAAHQAGLKVYVWTVNSQKGMEKALRLGVDGIISDEVELLQKVIAANVFRA